MNASLTTALKQLRLSGLLESLDVRLQEAAGHQLKHAEFLELILQDELAVRDQRHIERRVKLAVVPRAQDARRVRLVVQSVDQEEAGLRPGDLPLRPRGPRRAAPRPARTSASRSWPRRSATRRSSKGIVVLYRSIFDVVRDFLHDEVLGQDDKLLARYLKPDLLDHRRHGHEALAPPQRRSTCSRSSCGATKPAAR